MAGCLTESDVLAEFGQVMRDWDHAPWREGKLVPPDPADAMLALWSACPSV